MSDNAVAIKIKGPVEALPVPADEKSAVLSMIERAARDPAVDIDKLERLMTMQRQMLTTDSPWVPRSRNSKTRIRSWMSSMLWSQEKDSSASSIICGRPTTTVSGASTATRMPRWKAAQVSPKKNTIDAKDGVVFLFTIMLQMIPP